jgi:hypothetical protein
VLDRKHRREIGETIWRSLLDSNIGLVLLWQDQTTKRWHAYAQYPMLPGEDDLPWWAYDTRATLMQQGDTAKAAASALLTDPRLGSRDGLTTAVARLACELERLAWAIRHD